MHKNNIFFPLSGILLCAICFISSCQAPISYHNKSIHGNAIICTKRRLATITPDRLIVTTSKPAFAPWVLDDNPSSHKGLESAVIYSIARELGYNDADISWIRTTFSSMFAPGKKNFDLAINQISINAERKKNVDFSAPYYNSTQVVVVKKTNSFARSHSLEELYNARIGAMDQSTAVPILIHSLPTKSRPKVFDSQLDTIIALNNNQIDALITDSPTAEQMIKYQIPQGKILGLLPNKIAKIEHFGIALDKNSPLTACITWALDKLRTTGRLDILTRKWIGLPLISELTIKR